MTNLSIVSRDEVSENQVIRSRVAKTQQLDAERLMNNNISGPNEQKKIIFFISRQSFDYF